MEVFEQNPALKDKLFAEMRIMGIEPERNVVGNKLNSINPVTGQPEFFIKKLFRGLKKVVKAILPVVAKVFLTTITGNPVLASAIVDGASAIIQGGSFKDGLKAAAIGGISSFAAGKLGNKFDWAKSTAGRMGAEAAINTTLSGGKPRDILKAGAIGALAGKGTDVLSDFIRGRATDVIDVTADDVELDAVMGTDDLQALPPQAQAAQVTKPDVPFGPEPGPLDPLTSTDPIAAGEGPATQAAEGRGTMSAEGPATRTDFESFALRGRVLNLLQILR